MSEPLEQLRPDPYALADDHDQLDWDTAQYGRMSDYAATAEETVETVPWQPDDDGGRQVADVRELPAALARRGLTVEVVPGWATRSAGSFNPRGAVAHWTAGPARSRTRPSLNVVTNGRPGLRGPLCNVYLDRRGIAVVVAAGRANHAGAGSWRGLVGNSAVFGTEAEAAGPDDWTADPRVNAAYCDLGGFGPEMICGHSEWAGPRKQDINGYTTDQLRTQVADILAGGDDDMPFTFEQLVEAANRGAMCQTPADRDGAWAFDMIQGVDERTGLLVYLVQKLVDKLDRDPAANKEAVRSLVAAGVREGMAAAADEDDQRTADEIVDGIVERLTSPEGTTSPAGA